MMDPARDMEHPEELLDGALRSQLSDGEWTDLRQHLSSCAVCALQFRGVAGAAHPWATDPAPASPLTARETQLNRAAVDRVLLRLEGSRRRAFIRSPGQWARVAVGMVLLSGTAAAAGWWAVRSPVEIASVRSPGMDGSLRPRRVAVIRRERPAEDEMPTGDDQGPPLTAPSSLAAPPESSRAAGAATDQIAPARTRGRAGGGLGTSAATLLQQARRLRLEGDDARARSTYLRLQQIYPRSSESQLSHVLLGRMYLEGDRPQAADRQFSAYLSLGGAASEEALVGRATALARLGRVNEEAAAWRALLAAHPRSLYAKRARARLAGAGLSPTRPTSTPGVR